MALRWCVGERAYLRQSAAHVRLHHARSLPLRAFRGLGHT